MKVYGDIESVNLSTGERFRRVSGNGESRLESCCEHHRRLGPRRKTFDEEVEDAKWLEEFLRVGTIKLKEKKAMKVRAKFVCSFVDQKCKTVYMNPVYTGSDENKQFFAATPGGTITLNVLNEAALSAFEQGKEYYIDFTPAT